MKSKGIIYFIVLFLISFYACSHISEDISDSIRLTREQTKLLADEILKNTPEYIHFKKTFLWVLISSEAKDNMPELFEEVIRKLKVKYKVYLNESDIPEHLKIRSSQGMLLGYKDGFKFVYKISSEKNNILIICYNDWEGNAAGSYHCEKYQWDLTNWLPVDDITEEIIY